MGAPEADPLGAVVAAIRRLPADAARQLAQELSAAAASEWLLTEDAAAIARVSPSTIRWWVQTGQVSAKRAGRRLRIRRVDLDNFLSGGA